MSTGRRGGVDDYTVLSGGATDPRIRSGLVDPEGAIVGNPGDVWLRINGGPGATFYVKTSGVGTNTGWVAFGQSGIKHLFIGAPAPSPGTVGDHIGNTVPINGEARMEFRVPTDFSSVFDIEMIVIPGGTVASGATLTLNSDYGAPGELYDAHSESNSFAYVSTLNVVKSIDVSSVFSSLAPSDSCGLKVDNLSVTGGYLLLGLLFCYK